MYEYDSGEFGYNTPCTPKIKVRAEIVEKITKNPALINAWEVNTFKKGVNLVTETPITINPDPRTYSMLNVYSAATGIPLETVILGAINFGLPKLFALGKEEVQEKLGITAD